MELEHIKRPYLLSERLVPIADVSRRMSMIQAKYQETQDFHERTLLRGEYKYFSGKPCDVRAAQVSDLICFLECAAFFKFWDVSQVDRVVDVLHRRMMIHPLEPEEMVHVAVCLPELRKESSVLYQHVCRTLLTCAHQLTVEDCAKICIASVSQTPGTLLIELMKIIRPAVPALAPSILVELLDTLSTAVVDTYNCPRQLAFAACEESWPALLQDLECHLIPALPKLNLLELSIAYTAFTFHREILSETQHLSIIHQFVERASESCPRSLAMFLTGLSGPLLRWLREGSPVASTLADATQSSSVLPRSLTAVEGLAERVVFHSVDMNPTELIPAVRVLNLCLLGLQKCEEHETIPELDLAVKDYICRKQRLVVDVLCELTEQLVFSLEEAVTFLPSSALHELILLQDSLVKGLVALKSSEPRDAPVNRLNINAAIARVLRWIPHNKRLWDILSCKVAGCCTAFTTAELDSLHDVAAPGVLNDAAKRAVNSELKRRSADVCPRR